MANNTKKVLTKKISEILGISIRSLAKGSTLRRDWLVDVYEVVTGEAVQDKTSKHQIFKDIALALGSPDDEAWSELVLISEGATVTTDGIDYLHERICDWNRLAKHLNCALIPREITEGIIENGYGLILPPQEGLSLEDRFQTVASDTEGDVGINESEVLGHEWVLVLLGRIDSDSGDAVVEETDSEDDGVSPLIATKKITPSYKSTDVRTLVPQIDEGELDLDPPWQRRKVWSLVKQRKLIHSVLVGVPLPNLIFYSPEGAINKHVVDGKQRLTALHDYVKGRFKFLRVSIRESEEVGDLGGYTLKECSEKYFDELPEIAKKVVRDCELQTVTLMGLQPAQVYEIFTIYNSMGTRLNNAEIRNASYQEHPVHAALVELAGELKDEDWSPWTTQFRLVIGNGNPGPKRYKQKDFLERYLGYSRAYREEDEGGSTIGRLTTARSIRAYLEATKDCDEGVAEDVVAEIKSIWDSCYLCLPGSWCTHEGKFHALFAVDTMILMRFCLELNEAGLMEPADISAIMQDSRVTEPPEKQNSKTIWDHHIKSVSNLWSNLSEDQKGHLESVPKMVDALNRFVPQRE